jgi:hypothetical protein
LSYYKSGVIRAPRQHREAKAGDYGIDPGRITTIGCDELRPIATN